MSKVKNPQEKKEKSYKKDCRNSYGENNKASRKCIPQFKARGERKERRKVTSSLINPDNLKDPYSLEKSSINIHQASNEARKTKKPDMPLGEYLRKKG